MKSPFPGMDPYIEARGLWADFHHHLISEIKCALAAAVPEQYVVRTGERAYVVLGELEDRETHPIVIDAAPATEAVGMRAFMEERYRETFVEVYETDPEQRLVTCVEVLSPSNKRHGSKGWKVYQRKRKALLLGAANLVEIDLLRGGQKLPMLDAWPNSPYTLLVCRQSRAPYCQVWRGHWKQPLPVIPVPLASPDPDVSLPLQPMIEAIYARARYHRSIDYGRPLAPPLNAEEQAWLAEQLRAQQTRA